MKENYSLHIAEMLVEQRETLWKITRGFSKVLWRFKILCIKMGKTVQPALVYVSFLK